MIYTGDALEVLKGMPEASVDAVVTDPPYGIRFMGKAWDGTDIVKRHGDRKSYASEDPTGGPNGGHKSIAAEAGKYDRSPEASRAFQAFSSDWSAAAARVLKPGGHLVAFASPRTYHRMVCGIEDAGWEIRDCLLWVFGSGFPKSFNLHGKWEGWGTGLKPAFEPILLARKRFPGRLPANIEKHGAGAINIAACMTPTEDVLAGSKAPPYKMGGQNTRPFHDSPDPRGYRSDLGRWPANLIHDGSPEVVEAFPFAPGQQADASSSSSRKNQNVYGAMRRGRGNEASANDPNEGAVGFKMRPGARRLDSGSAARFFYCAKASKAERGEGNTHPTVKPLALMRWLVRLTTPVGGTVLDPFMGSGSTGVAALSQGFQFVGIERELAYIEMAEKRIANVAPLFYQPEVQQ